MGIAERKSPSPAIEADAELAVLSYPLDIERGK